MFIYQQIDAKLLYIRRALLIKLCKVLINEFFSLIFVICFIMRETFRLRFYTDFVVYDIRIVDNEWNIRNGKGEKLHKL